MEYTGVLLENFPGLLPICEIEFAIDLVPGTFSILIPAVLYGTRNELETQLEGLQFKGFIRSNKFLGGVVVLFTKKFT